MHESSDEFELRPVRTTGCGVSCPRTSKNPHWLIMGKMMSPLFSTVLDQILFIFAGNDNIHESLDEFEIWLDLVSMVTDRVMMGKTVSPLFLGCFSSDPFHTCRQ